MKKVQITFSDEQVEILEGFKGVLGESNAEIVRSIILAWLAEKSFISEATKPKLKEMVESHVRA